MEQLLEHGGAARSAEIRRQLGWRAVHELQAAGDLVRASGRVLRLAESNQDLVARLRRAEVHVGIRLIACSYTAAVFEGFGVLTDDRLHVTTANGVSLPAPCGVVIHQQPPRSAVVEIDGALMTTPVDTAIDLACTGSAMDTLAILDAAMRVGLSRDALSEAVERARGRRGLVKIRNWLPYADWRADSPMESRTRYLFLDNGFPPPDVQVRVDVSSGGSRYLDLGWREFRVGCDYDGEQFHGAGSLASDRQRHNELAESGWRMYYPTAPDVYRSATTFLARIAAALHEAGCGTFGRKLTPADVPRPAGPPDDLLAGSRRFWSLAPGSGGVTSR